MEYRIYLLDADKHIRAAEGFIADSDDDARQTAVDAYRLASGRFDGYELWRGSTFISAVLHGREHVLPPANRLNDARRRRLLELEDRLAQTFEVVRSSRDLMARVDALRRGSGAQWGNDQQAPR